MYRWIEDDNMFNRSSIHLLFCHSLTRAGTLSLSSLLAAGASIGMGAMQALREGGKNIPCSEFEQGIKDPPKNTKFYCSLTLSYTATRGVMTTSCGQTPTWLRHCCCWVIETSRSEVNNSVMTITSSPTSVHCCTNWHYLNTLVVDTICLSFVLMLHVYEVRHEILQILLWL